MKHQRNQKAKTFGASRELTRLEKQIRDEDSHIERCAKIPPALSFIIKQTAKRRFVSAGSISNLAFTLANGHQQFLVVTSALGAAVPYVDSWRLRSISVWVQMTQNAGSNAQSSFSISPVGSDISSNNFNDPEKIWECDGLSTASPGRMKIVCGKKTPLGGWHFTSNVNFAGTLFQYNNVTSGPLAQTIVMDLEFDTLLNLAGLPLGYGVTTATTTVGTIGGRSIPGFGLIGVNNLG